MDGFLNFLFSLLEARGGSEAPSTKIQMKSGNGFQGSEPPTISHNSTHILSIQSIQTVTYGHLHILKSTQTNKKEHA